MIPLFSVGMSEEAQGAVVQTLSSGYIGQGPKVEEFEGLLKKHFDRGRVLTTNSCTSAIHLALRMTKFGGAEVLTTPLTCAATNMPILDNEMRISWVDVDPKTCNMDLKSLEKRLSPWTKVIIVVHWGGYPVDMDELERVLDRCEEQFKFRPWVIEDCAHAWGSKYKGAWVGTSHCNFAAYSFGAIKNLTCGDGGALICPTNEFYRRGKLLRWYGLDRESNHDFRCDQNISEWGYKFHMNDINATIGIHNYPYSLMNVKVQQGNTVFYRKELANVSGLQLLEQRDGFDSSGWLFTVLVERRSDFIRKLKACGIDASPVHSRNDKHDCVRWAINAGLPQLDSIADKIVCIPNGWWVTRDQTEYIADTIKGGW